MRKYCSGERSVSTLNCGERPAACFFSERLESVGTLTRLLSRRIGSTGLNVSRHISVRLAQRRTRPGCVSAQSSWRPGNRAAWLLYSPTVRSNHFVRRAGLTPHGEAGAGQEQGQDRVTRRCTRRRRPRPTLRGPFSLKSDTWSVVCGTPGQRTYQKHDLICPKIGAKTRYRLFLREVAAGQLANCTLV